MFIWATIVVGLTLLTAYNSLSSLFVIVPVIVSIVLIIPSLAIACRRWHDAGLKWYWYIIYLVVVFLLSAIDTRVTMVIRFVLALVGLVIALLPSRRRAKTARVVK